jgi:hypothetical protein
MPTYYDWLSIAMLPLAERQHLDQIGGNIAALTL